ncbi:hypothetical protein BC834DRAFT_828556, partial [Gloeopeniophorella convolvens]
RRGGFSTISFGLSYGGGQETPGFLSRRGPKDRVIGALLASSDVGRIAGFQSSTLRYWFPLALSHMRRSIEPLTKSKPVNFKHSEYPTATANLGPQTVCLGHNDSTNYPGLPCAVTAMGSFDPDFGGHLVLPDLSLKVRFPAGCTVLLPSAGLRHGNTPVSEGETRYSFTQYCPGGLLRWVRYGLKPKKHVPADEARKIDAVSDDGWGAQLSRFSKLEEVVEDRRRAFPRGPSAAR